ncbi:MAG: hypothetical protein CVT48_01945 [Thermoplasmata archaeon HGW-Thermoplasmata-1]|nr:MAG: hypothetical protein CVT48_01945 [Thermoplasmata archaeon HGW-Thermoplasmata-1]
MELKLINKNDNELEIELIGENETLLNPLKQKLLAEPGVDYAESIITNQMLANPRLYLRMKTGDPAKILEKAAKDLEKELKEFSAAFEKALPQES